MKNCTKCKIEKNLSEFNKDSYTKDGLRPKCKLCFRKDKNEFWKNKKEERAKYHRNWRDKNKDRISEERKIAYNQNKEYYKNIQLKSKFKITLDEYYQMFIKQNNLCAICKIHKDKTKRGLHVDHCHKTKKVRGLLCMDCNTAIGKLKEDLQILENAIQYIKNN